MRHVLSTDNKMSLHRETISKPSILVEGRSHSDTCIYMPIGYVPKSVNTDGIQSTYSVQTSPNKKTYSMGWLAKLIKPKPEETKFHPISHEEKTHIIEKRVPTENGGPPSHVLQHIPSPTTPEDNVYYTMKLKIHKLPDYATSWQELSKSPSNISIVKETKKRKADDLDSDAQTKRRRESVDDNNNIYSNKNLPRHIDNNNNLRHFADDNNNLEDDELDAEVAMYMENSGPPTIRADRGSNMESELPWLRCIEGCYHSYRSPLGITREPREGAIRILDPWPCLYRNTKFGELKKFGGLNKERAPQHWRKGDENN